MDFGTETVKFSEIKQDAYLAELYSKIYCIPKSERVKVLMSWLANAYADLFIPVLSEAEALTSFTVHVRLLDTFSNNSAYEIVAQLASEFADTFLHLQVIPNLLENFDKACDVTYYIQIICENLTCPSLIHKLVEVFTKQLTPILIDRMTSKDHLVASSTLSLIKTLLEFYCEDFWYDLILQYLLPMKHLLTTQRQKLLPEIEYHESTHKLLEFIPCHVTRSTNPSLLADHFIMYYQDEITRLRVIDAAVAASIPSSESALRNVGLSLSTDKTETTATVPVQRKNQTYPMWVFRYDGTDFLHALRKGYFHEEPEEFFEDDLFSETNQLDHSASPTVLAIEIDEAEGKGSVSSSEVGDLSNDFTDEMKVTDTVNGKPDSPTDSVGSLRDFIVKDKRKSIDDRRNSSSDYFGPFLHTLFEILQKWTLLEPDVLFTATEVVSVLASSRVPLINTLFLDMSVTLQPSYPSFSKLIYTIKNEMDETLKTYPDYIFRNAWKAAAKECSLVEFYTNQGQSSTSDDEDSQPSLVGKLRRKITSTRSLRMAAEEVQRSMGIGRRGSSFRAFTDVFKNSQGSDRTSEYRLLNRTAGSFDSEEEENAAKVMALRSILFTHWMLELAAIALQLSWGRLPFSVYGKSDFEAVPTSNADDDTEEVLTSTSNLE